MFVELFYVRRIFLSSTYSVKGRVVFSGEDFYQDNNDMDHLYRGRVPCHIASLPATMLTLSVTSYHMDLLCAGPNKYLCS